jgi:uncharacterized protein YbbK (DUF523 family)
MNTQPVIGISGCLTGSAVRFDGGHKRMGFVMDELAQWVAFKPVCPEMAIGLPSRARRCGWCKRPKGKSACASRMHRTTT